MERQEAYTEWLVVYEDLKKHNNVAAVSKFCDDYPNAVNNQKQGSGNTLLHQLAYWRSSTHVLAQMRLLGANPDILNADGQTAEDVCSALYPLNPEIAQRFTQAFPPEYVCAVCSESFASQNQLFEHLQEQGHSGASEGHSAATSPRSFNADASLEASSVGVTRQMSDVAASLEAANSQVGSESIVAGEDAQSYDCCICGDTVVHTDQNGKWANGIVCKSTDHGPHYVCSECFCDYVVSSACVPPDGVFEAECDKEGNVSHPGEFPCPGMPSCNITAFPLPEIFQVLVSQPDHLAFDCFHKSMIRVGAIKLNKEQQEAEEHLKAADAAAAATALGRARSVVVLALDLAATMQCPNGHSGIKDDACRNMECPICEAKWCYCCGGSTPSECHWHTGCGQDGDYLQHMPGFEAAGGDGDRAVEIFHFRRSQASLQVAKELILSTSDGAAVWDDLSKKHPELLRNVCGGHLNWMEDGSPADLLPKFGPDAQQSIRVRAQLTRFEASLRAHAAEKGMELGAAGEGPLELGLADTMQLNDGTVALVGADVIATGNSHYGHYAAGHTGTIVEVGLEDPVVHWDHSGMSYQTSRAKLEENSLQLSDGTVPTVGADVIATANSRLGHYAAGHTGTIVEVRPNDPVVHWDHSSITSQTNHTKLKLNSMRLSDDEVAAVGVRVIATGNSRLGHYEVGDTGTIVEIRRHDPVVRWDHSDINCLSLVSPTTQNWSLTLAAQHWRWQHVAPKVVLACPGMANLAAVVAHALNRMVCRMGTLVQAAKQTPRKARDQRILKEREKAKDPLISIFI